jgi:hypothetical protein
MRKAYNNLFRDTLRKETNWQTKDSWNGFQVIAWRVWHLYMSEDWKLRIIIILLKPWIQLYESPLMFTICYRDTFPIWWVHTRLRSWYFIRLSTWRNIRLQGYPFRHKEIYGHQTTDHKTVLSVYLLHFYLVQHCIFFIYVTFPFYYYFYLFICFDLDVSSRNYDCMYRLQLHRFNFTIIFLAQIQRIRWNS